MIGMISAKCLNLTFVRAVIVNPRHPHALSLSASLVVYSFMLAWLVSNSGTEWFLRVYPPLMAPSAQRSSPDSVRTVAVRLRSLGPRSPTSPDSVSSGVQRMTDSGRSGCRSAGSGDESTCSLPSPRPAPNTT